MKPLDSVRRNETVLICEADPEFGERIGITLKAFGYSIQSVRDQDAAVPFIRTSKTPISAFLFGVAVPDRGVLEILREIRAMDSDLPVIIIGGLLPARDVTALLKSGATDYLSRPIADGDLASVLIEALEISKSVFKSERAAGLSSTFRSANRQFVEIESKIGQIGWSGAPVLIQGETGSGKEILARSLHAQSARSHKPFVKVNCAALPSELIESELFGYERGSFTGAFEKKPGIFELADGGTILLDEIGDMDIRLQAKLLQVLQDQEFRRIGGKETIRVDVRIIAATHRDLEKAIHEGAFREDLYYRLSIIVLQVPPLRERSEDIIPLGEFLLRKHSGATSPIPVINMELSAAMLAYNWQGNVRELENYMRKLVIFRDPDLIARELYARRNRKPPASVRTADDQTRIDRRDDMPILEQVTKDNQQAEIDAILTALDSTRWNRKQAAEVLKIEYKSLLYKMKKLGVDDNDSIALVRRSVPARKSNASGV